MIDAREELLLNAVAGGARICSSSERMKIIVNFRSDPHLKPRQEMTFASMEDVIKYLRIPQFLGSDVFCLGYQVEMETCIQIKLEEAVDMLEKCNIVLSLDGFVIIRSDYCAAIIVDYEDVAESRSSGEVYVSLLGAWLVKDIDVHG